MAITIFATLKPFAGHFAVIQRNALASWKALDPTPEIILFGTEAGVEAAAHEVGAVHVPSVRLNEQGTPLISAMFEEAQRIAQYSVICYSNADIIFLKDLYAAIALAERQTTPYLLTGRRHNTDVNQIVDFSDKNQLNQLVRHALETGEKYPPAGMDYFIFKRGSLPNLPDFAVGRPRWDNWMIYHARRRRFMVIDATDAIFAIHQNHDYSHHRGGTDGVWHGVEAEQNLREAGGWDYIFTLVNATHTMDCNGIHRSKYPKSRFERLNEFAALHPWSRRPIKLIRRIRVAMAGNSVAPT